MAAHAANDGSSFHECARLTAGDPFPKWLAEYYQGWSSSIAIDIGVHSLQPPRKQMRAELQEIMRIVTSLERKLKSTPILEFLKMGELGPIAWLAQLEVIHLDISRRANYA